MQYFSIVDLLQIVRIIRKATEALRPENIPDITEPGNMFAWLNTMAEVLGRVVQMTATPIDDKALQWVRENVLKDYDTFKKYYDVFKAIIALLDKGEQDDKKLVAGAMAAVAQQPQEFAIPINILVVIIELIKLVYDLTRRG
jgi:hypothetical protein